MATTGERWYPHPAAKQLGASKPTLETMQPWPNSYISRRDAIQPNTRTRSSTYHPDNNDWLKLLVGLCQT